MFTVRFGSVFIKKSNQTEFFLKKKPKPVQTDRFRLGSVRFFREKTGSNRFGLIFPVWLGLAWFFGLTRFFRFGSVLARFGSVFFRFGSARFGFPVPGLKNRNRTGQFFQNFNRFFFTVRFFRLFFSGFLGLIGFSVFLNTPNSREDLFSVLGNEMPNYSQ